MLIAEGVVLKQEYSLNFSVGSAQRRKIDPQVWQIETPEPNTVEPISIAFDRIMGSAIVNRLPILQESGGNQIVGRATGDGGGWSLTPEKPWTTGDYYLKISPVIEDIAGNTIRAPFDAKFSIINSSDDY